MNNEDQRCTRYFKTEIVFEHVLGDGSVKEISNISRTKSPNFHVSRLVLQLSLPNPMKPGVKSRMKM